MKQSDYHSMDELFKMRRRQFLKTGVVGSGLLLGTPTLWAKGQEKKNKPAKPKTNVADVLYIPRTKHSLPGPFPGKVVEVSNEKVLVNSKPVPSLVQEMVQKGITQLTGINLKRSFDLFFTQDDVIGIKVNPVGPRLINTHLEVVDVLIDWLTNNGLKRNKIIIWDRFDYMLADAGFTPERYPGIQIIGLQTMDEAAAEGKTKDNSKWLDKNGHHVSEANFDKDVYYWVDVDGPKDKAYLNQHVFNGKYSYFGKLLTQKLTKIINVPVFKNTGNGISMATKNIGYGSVCNTNRLHKPLFFNVNTEVSAFPVIRDKLVLNITDALRGQYEGGPGAAAQFIYDYNRLFFATDPFALDMVCQELMVQKRKKEKVRVNEHPMFTEYLHYAERLGLGIADERKIQHIVV